jgi:hypothetical protein
LHQDRKTSDSFLQSFLAGSGQDPSVSGSSQCDWTYFDVCSADQRMKLKYAIAVNPVDVKAQMTVGHEAGLPLLNPALPPFVTPHNGRRMSGVRLNRERSECIQAEVRSMRWLGGGERQRSVG